ncbi:TIGR03557 family F420-dependent LLM class oxidoreductase [Patulibacter sp. S7RM1-6]
MKIGYFLSSEEYGPRGLLQQAAQAREAGFSGLWISDHYHPWNDAQGQSPFVWSTIGALSQVVPGMPITTGVTCPTVRIHPAILAQAVATTAVLTNGAFRFGIGTGEALNEHVLGDAWPEADVRLEMLEEAVEIMRELWTGKQVSHYGAHYAVENARIYTLPEETPEVYVSAFGPKAAEVAGRIGDGFCTVGPEEELIRSFRRGAKDGAIVQAGMKVRYAADEAEARATAHRLWPNDALPGELAQVLPTPAHFEQASELVTEDLVAETIACGPDIDLHLERIQAYADAGVDELYVQQVGGDVEPFFAAYREHVLPKFG